MSREFCMKNGSYKFLHVLEVYEGSGKRFEGAPERPLIRMKAVHTDGRVTFAEDGLGHMMEKWPLDGETFMRGEAYAEGPPPLGMK